VTHRKATRPAVPKESATLPILRECARLLREYEAMNTQAELLMSEMRGLVRGTFVVSGETQHPWPSSRAA
jgi:hypothetical protein